ncbi:MAG: formylglycine-generating enzyme family protein [Gallionellaceae bacterium]|jgi:formylglycine-generating enzyme required for sulfatase activity|nr:formylglycine-generating enzyme family protein [Gallionellaceae bacterium]
MKIKLWMILGIFCCVLAACGGGGGNDVAEEPPECSASQVLQNNACVTAPAGTAFLDCVDVCPTMVVIPAGSFTMGSPDSEPGRSNDEGPQHQVTIAQPFAVGQSPVTVAQWSAFIQATGYAGDPAAINFDCLSAGAFFPQTSNDPVVCVNWNEAQAYVQWLSQKTGKSYRLLSEAEWEYVARAGTQTAYPFPNITTDQNGNQTTNELAKYANYYDFVDYTTNSQAAAGSFDGFANTSPVGSYPKNAFGLNDVIGNVWEWTQDCFHIDYQNAPTTGVAWQAENGGNCSFRVLRGGSWDFGPQVLRAAFRGWDEPAGRSGLIGLRVARTVP